MNAAEVRSIAADWMDEAITTAEVEQRVMDMPSDAFKGGKP